LSKPSFKILVIIPVYNESENIVEVLDEIHATYPDLDMLVVNDASTDGSGELAESTGLATVVNLPINLGIGGSVQTGFKYARNNDYDIVLQLDGDGQHKVSEIEKLIEPIMNGDADVVIGSRFNRKSKGFTTQALRRVGIKIFEWFSYVLIQQRITDHTSGFRSFNNKSFSFLAENYPTDYPEPEVVILLGRNRFRILEVFTQMMKRQGGVSSIPVAKGPYYMMKVLLSMFMASIRSRIIKEEKPNS